jgi:hypothetical protein
VGVGCKCAEYLVRTWPYASTHTVNGAIGLQKVRTDFELADLQRKPNAVQEILETWVRAERIKGGPFEDAWVKPRFIAFLKP